MGHRVREERERVEKRERERERERYMVRNSHKVDNHGGFQPAKIDLWLMVYSMGFRVRGSWCMASV